ncbi:hypothetical protein MKK69_20395 [Methylobacterium sp. J-026]|uniref:hypothetical protein n=1 Tax=Methylobacterium sp. J-026 TaxID=2836624 RepID=UPI001FB8BFD1|nr:hypothetical protein [Methylobacterium sp. J-026]MCJ2136380.1 hypothetical protein [Methylobacterium sp. J-026]
MIARPLLQRDDFLWWLDNSRRHYRVRPTRLGDLTFRFGETYPDFITVVPLDGRKSAVMKAQCELFPDDWEDTDRYASARLNAIAIRAAARQRGGCAMSADLLTFPRNRVRRVEADSVRLSYDFNRWCSEQYRGERFLRRFHFDRLLDARAEVERLVANGLRRLPDARPDWTDVAYGSLSDGGLDDDPDPRLSDLLDEGGVAV